MKVNYVITCWSGIRRFMEDTYTKDRTHFLKIQIAQLKKLKNSLSQITFVINHNPKEDANYKKFVDDMPKEINGVPLVVIRRDNVGLMFGAWLHICKTYEKEFDYNLVTEDDYVPVLDGFDNIFLSAIKKEVNCGFLCPEVTAFSLYDFNKWEEKYGPLPEEMSHLDKSNVNVPLCVVGMIPRKCISVLLRKYVNICNENSTEETDRGLIFFAMNAEGYTINQLKEYSSSALLHEHSIEKPWKFTTYGKGPLLFAPTLYTEITELEIFDKRIAWRKAREAREAMNQ